MASILDQHDAIEFLVADRNRRVLGFTWLVESSGTSFYIKPLLKPFTLAKVSLHGPDPAHDAPHNRVGMVSNPSMIGRAYKAGGGMAWGPQYDRFPFFFEGRQVSKTVRHVVRFRTSWELFTSSAPSAPPAPIRQKATQRRCFHPPDRFQVMEIDFYLSSVRPYWPGGEARTQTGGYWLGPMTNVAGQYLTAVGTQLPQSGRPGPYDHLLSGSAVSDCFRDLGFHVDDDNVLWICEVLVPWYRRGRFIDR